MNYSINSRLAWATSLDSVSKQKVKKKLEIRPGIVPDTCNPNNWEVQAKKKKKKKSLDSKFKACLGYMRLYLQKEKIKVGNRDQG